MEPFAIHLFISRESATYHYVKRQVEIACTKAFGETHYRLRVIDIAERPDLAEKNNIEALPTVVIGGRRFIGAPDPETFADFLSSVPGEPNCR